MLREMWVQRSKFNAAVLDKLREKCESETRFGRVANLLLWALFFFFKKAKKLRVTAQNVLSYRLGNKTSTAVLFSDAAKLISPTQAPRSKIRILIIGEDSLSQCKRYRIDAKLSMLQALDYEVEFFSCWSKNELAWAALPFCTIVIFYRVPLLPQWQRFAEAAKTNRCRVVWEIDDLVFNPTIYATHPYIQTCSHKERDELLNGSRLFARFMDSADEFIVSTDELRSEILHLHAKPVSVIENAIDDQLLEAAKHVSSKNVDVDQILIGYGSGTLTHDADLNVAAPAIAEVMQKNSAVRLILLGHLNIPPVLEAFGSRIQKVPFVDPKRYFQLLAALDICIAPLVESRFNEVKSNIKFLEAAVLGVPCIASPSGPFRKAIDPGVSGLLAANHNEWVAALEKLIQDPGLRASMATQAHKKALELYHPDVIRDGQLKSWILDTTQATSDSRSLNVSSKTDRRTLGVVNVFFAPQSFGGATIVAEELAKKLAETDWDVTVFTGNTFDDLADYELRVFSWGRIRVYSVRLPRNTTQDLEYRNDTIQSIFSRYLGTEKPDVLHIHCVQHLGAGLLLEAQRHHVPAVVTLHDAWWICPRQFRYIHEKQANCPYTVQNPISCGACFGRTAARVERDLFLRKTLSGVSLFLAPSRFQGELYIKNGFPRDRVRLNGNGVKLPNRPRQRIRKADGHHIVFAHLGGPSEQKGYPQIAAAFARVSHSNYTLRLTDSDRRLGIKTQLGKGLRLKGKVEVVAPFSQDTIDEFFDGIDVLIAYSQWDECFGLVVREALARDVWVICSDAGGLPEAIDEGVNGNVVPRHDQESLVAALEGCLNNPTLVKNHTNSRKQEVRAFAQQAQELSEILSSVTR